MNKFMQSNQTKRHIAQKLHNFLCSLTYYKSVTRILQNGYKWLQVCNHSNFTETIEVVIVFYTGRAGIYTHKGAANELRLGAAFRSYVWELRLEATK